MAKINKQITSFPNPQLKFNQSLKVPGDKSISHRSMILGGLASGVTQVHGFLESEDCLATKNAMQSMGVKIKKEGSVYEVQGVGLNGLKRPVSGEIDCGNAGTGMRLLAGVLAAQNFDVKLTGDKSLQSRPMSRVVKPLKQMGAMIQTAENHTAPLNFQAVKKLNAIDYVSPIASAQVKSCVLLAGLYANGVTSVLEPKLSRDHTENMLTGFGCEVEKSGLKVSIKGLPNLIATDVIVPSDISSAAFFMVLTLLSENSQLLLKDVCVNPSRAGVIHILQKMGAKIFVENQRESAGESIADVHVESSKLSGITIPEDLIPSAIDEFPIVFIAAALANGTTRLQGAEELRVKESDRISVMSEGLQRLGVSCTELPDGILIQGGKLKGGRVDSHGDHRCAMSFLIAGQFASGEIKVDNCENIATSFPNFLQLCDELGVLTT